MSELKYATVKEKIFWSYANLAMAHTGVFNNQEKYAAFNFMIRARLFKGLKTEKMNLRTLFDDEKIKIKTGLICNYCGSSANLALDHIFPKKHGGQDKAENLIYSCRPCNSSKGKKDLMEWMNTRGRFLPLMVIRRYLKLTYDYCYENDLLEKKVEDLNSLKLPFKIDLLPTDFPNPRMLVLNMELLEQ